MARTRTWDESIRKDEQHSNVRLLVVEPGDATRYELAVIELPDRVSDQMALRRGSYLVINHNLTGRFVCMQVFPGQYVSWKMVKDEMHITAPGSAWMITEILAHLYGTTCQTWEEFSESYRRSNT